MYPSSRRNVMKGPLLHLLEYLTLLRHQFFLHVSAYLPSHALPSINELFALKEERMLKDMALTTKAFVSNKLTFEALLRSVKVDKQDWKCNTNYQRNFDIKHMPSLCIDYSGILSFYTTFPLSPIKFSTWKVCHSKKNWEEHSSTSMSFMYQKRELSHHYSWIHHWHNFSGFVKNV